MTTPDLKASLPSALTSLETKPLFIIRLAVGLPAPIGDTPNGYRKIGIISGGYFQGDRLRGEILGTGGADWMTKRIDGSTALDVRLVLKTDDGATIAMQYKGVRNGPADIMAKIDKGEAVEPESYYFRMSASFETGSPKYSWLNNIVAIGKGHRTAEGPTYQVFEVL